MLRNSVFDLILTELGLAQIFYNVQGRKNKEETSSARLHSLTHSCNCGQNYWAQLSKIDNNSKIIVSKVGNISSERTVSFQTREQTFSLAMHSTKIM